jgi:uncharacterized protein
MPRMVAALTDAELDRLEDLLAAAPAPLQALGAVELDGFLCGVLVQPQRLDARHWLPVALGASESGIRLEGVDGAWLAQVAPLMQRHHDALRETLVEHGGFDPVLPGQALDAPDEDPDLVEPSRVLWPWVAGFALAQASFAALDELAESDREVAALLERLWRHLPAASEYERDARDALNRELPLPSVAAAIDDLVAAVVELSDRTEPLRYHVTTVRRDAPKVGCNDPCPCGSGRKYKQCCGAGR